MGLSITRFSKSWADGGGNNPNPAKFKITSSEQIENFLIVQVKYDGCTNFEGEKLLVYQDVILEDLIKQGTIDPHFSNNPNYISPIARFVPTKKGWFMAQELCDSLWDCGDMYE